MTPPQSLSRPSVSGNAPGRGAPLSAVLLLVLGAVLMGGLVLLVSRKPGYGVLIPLAVIGALAARRWPVPAVLSIFLYTGAIGTLTAFTFVPVTPLAEFTLVSLWLGVAGTYVLGRPERRMWLWPALAAPGLFILLSAFQIPFAEELGLGANSFRAATWHMLALVMIAIAPWRQRDFERITRGFVVLAFAIGAYSLFRWLTGTSTEEEAAVRAALPRLHEDPRFFGSWLSPNQLALWCATVIPFCLALTLSWRGRWRLIALGAVATLAVSLLAADVRTGVAAVALGVVVTLLVYQLSPAFPGRTGVALLGFCGVAIIAGGAYLLAIEGSQERTTRLEGLLNPADQVTYTERLKRWDHAIELMSENPLGLGLGTVGEIAATENPAGAVVDRDLDSSYLKIGVEQGWAMMILFIAALLGLLVGLARRAITMRDRFKASLVVGSCGTLAAMMVMFYSGLYIEGMPVVGAWMLIGLGVAQVTLRDEESAPQAPPAAVLTQGPPPAPMPTPDGRRKPTVVG